MPTKSFPTFLILICISISNANRWEPTDIPHPKVDNDIINSISSFSPIFISMNTCMFVSAVLGVTSGKFRYAFIKALFTWYLVVMITTNFVPCFITDLICFPVMFAMILLGFSITQ